MKTIKDTIRKELKKFAQGNVTNEYHPDETIDRIVAEFESILKEVIGETEAIPQLHNAQYILEAHDVKLRNGLRTEQQARAKELLGK